MIDYEAAAGTAPSTSNVPFLEGDHDHKILVVDARNFMGRNGNKYIIKVRVLATEKTGQVPSPGIGADRAVIINLDPPKKEGDPDYGLQNLINFASGCNGGPIEGATKEEKGAKLKRLLGTRAIGATEAARRGIAPVEFTEAGCIGVVVGDRAVQDMTKGSPGNPPHPIVYHNWYTIKNDPAKFMERKKALKENTPVDCSDALPPKA